MPELNSSPGDKDPSAVSESFFEHCRPRGFEMFWKQKNPKGEDFLAFLQL